MSIKAFTQKTTRFMNANADIIMTVGALIGLGTTIYLTARQMPEIMEASDSYKADTEALRARRDSGEISVDIYESELRNMKLHYAKIFAKLLAPPTASALGTGALIIGSTKAGRAKQAVLSSLLNSSNVALSSYKDYMKKELGEKKFDEIDTSYEKERVADIPKIASPTEIISTGKGEKLFSIDVLPWDPDTRVFFRSSPEAVHEGVVSLKEYIIDTKIDAIRYDDYLFYIIGNQVNRDKKTFAPAKHLYHYMDDIRDWPQPIYKEFIHDKLGENWCHITFREDDWEY